MGLFDMFKKKASRPDALDIELGSGELAAPASGALVRLDAVSDPVFGSGMMGLGCGIKPDDEVVYAPTSGTLTAIGAPNHHAIGLMGDDGSEILIHVGVNTVEMHGDGFTTYAEKGSHVRAGEPVLGFSSSKIRAKGFDDVVIMAVTNSGDYASVDLDHEGPVRAGEVALRLAR